MSASRICVKNLPSYVAEDRLREFFSQKGEVTDAQIKRTTDWKSRQFGFVGFRTEQEAQDAISYFNKSFFDTHRIVCEIARGVGDPNIPRPWSHYSLQKRENSSMVSALSKVGASTKEKSKKDDQNDDPQLQEFLQVMQPRSKSKLWANDTVQPANQVSKEKLQKKPRSSKIVPDTERKGNGSLENNEAEKPVRDTERKGNGSVEDNEDEKPTETVSDMDYFRSRVKKDWSDSESESDSDEDSDSGSDSAEQTRDASLEPDSSEGDAADEEPSGEGSDQVIDSADPSSAPKEDEEILETGRLFVRNLPYTATEEELEEHFREFGDISQVHIVVDKETKRSKGFAYVLYALPESAARALQELDNSIFQGRLLHVMPAKLKNQPEKQELNLNSKTLKQKRTEERKASEISGNTRAWNSLFMRPDTVVENIARKFGVSKSELLDREADDLAVRFALGETQVIAETKKALSNAGVNVSSLEEYAGGRTDGLKRSNHVILVKNLPYGSSESELANMFGKFGSLDKVILPPTRTLALVVFLEPAEARAAFRGLAYKRYKDAPLYLEWAPGNILSERKPNDSNDTVIAVEHDAKRVLLEQQAAETIDAEADRIESRSVHIKNLNFKTTEHNLTKHFTEHMKEGKIISVTIKKHIKNGKNVSMGYGFIEFDSVNTAVKVCKDLQGSVLDGHALILQISHAKKDSVVRKKVDNDKSSTKLIVRNVAFEATKKDIRQLFSPFGQIKSLRLPMKLGGNHRGFAFIEFVTKQEAQNALEALSNTHLYGRHLVLERAKEGETLEELQVRTAAQFMDSTKLSKKRKHMAVLDEGNVKFQRVAE